ncbi:hypothetical protein EV182_003078 [Spiromyces aspiralis]|uniref:Uncharacterized protein n=1 Tax=Spiromyces aspiralis TaxID=68401 RepID=A0ACC1HR40_9FUNG|nr:hypothetical protein EV182_003078 [Spiromyces aspiralis]
MNCIDVEIKGGSSSSYTGKQMMIANHPWYTSTVIPEFNGNYDTGLDLYSAQPQISVGPGASSGAYSVSGPAPAPASSANAAGSGYSTTTSSGGNNSGAYSVSANSGSSAGGASYGAGAPAPGPVAISTDGNANYFAAPPPGQAYSSQQQGGSPAGYSSVDQNVYPRGRSAPAENAAISTPNQSSASGACSGSAFQCSADGGISVCVNGVQYSLACAPGTKCKTVSDGLPVCA